MEVNSFQILLIDGQCYLTILTESGGSPGSIKHVCAQMWHKARSFSFSFEKFLTKSTVLNDEKYVCL